MVRCHHYAELPHSHAAYIRPPAWLTLLLLRLPRHSVITVLSDDQGYGDTSHTCDNSTGLCAR